MIEIRNATTIDIAGILDLQARNLKSEISPMEAKREGFVTLRHNFETLLRMNDLAPHTIVCVEGRVIAYALSMHPSLSLEVPGLEKMFLLLEGLDSYMVMGQVCVDKKYRGQGKFRSMYQFMFNKFSGEYKSIITEVSQANPRSLRAHYALGFQDYHMHEEWVILIKDLS